jgi:hypothetical protein
MFWKRYSVRVREASVGVVMVGGKVINIVHCEDSVWIQCIDRTYTDQTCAIYVKEAKEMKIGDALWWQGPYAFWTPKPDDGREDIQLERLGYSHSKVPDEILGKVLGI